MRSTAAVPRATRWSRPVSTAPSHRPVVRPGVVRTTPVSPRAAADLLVQGRRSATWTAGQQRWLVRGALPADLPAVAAMHGRCSRGTLLQRYRAGGRAPSLDHLVRLLRAPLTLVVEGLDGVVALGCAEHPAADDYRSEIGLLVQDRWQGGGIGSALATRLGSTLRSLGYAQVVTRSATATVPLHRVMQRLGPVRTLERSPATVLSARLTLPTVLQLGDDLTLG
jgi:GNAT superfamily N-acetyltransferase